MMSKIVAPHFLYGPAPKKGYSKRAVSPDIYPDEYERLMGCYIPFDPAYLRADDVTEREARAVVSVPAIGGIYFSRIFRRHKLDEKGRTGILAHTVLIPRASLSEGLSYGDIDKALVAFENANGIPLGDIPKLEITWEGDKTSSEMSRSRSLISKDSFNRLANAYRGDKNAKVILTSKGTPHRERAELGYAISRFLDLKLKVVPISFLTEPPLSLVNSNFNLVVTNMPLNVPPRIGWRPIDSKGAASGVDGQGSVGEEGITQALEEIYGEKQPPLHAEKEGVRLNVGFTR